MMAVKVSGYRSLDSLADWAGSCLVDIGYVSHEGAGFALISPDADAAVYSGADFDWFRAVVCSALETYGSEVTVHPEAIDLDKEDALTPVA